VTVLAQLLIDARRGWSARNGYGPIVDSHVVTRKHANAPRGLDLRPRAEVHDVAVAVHGEGGDGGAEGRGLPRLLLERGRKDLRVEIAVVDRDAIHGVHASQMDALSQRRQPGVSQTRITGRSDDELCYMPVFDRPFDLRGRPEVGSQTPKRCGGNEQLLVGRRIPRPFGPIAVQFLRIVEANDMNPDPIAQRRLPDEVGDRLRERLGPLGSRFRDDDQQADDRKTKKRAVRHRPQPSSALVLLLMMGLGCRPPVEQDAEALVVLLPRDAEQLDPRFVGDPYGLRVSRLLFGSLVTIDPQTLEVIPDLAESVTASSPTQFEVRLREGLLFSDGSALDAEDVVATFQGVIDPALGSRYAHTYRRIAQMRLSDPRTIVFVLNEPYATFLTDLELPILRSEDAFRRVATPDDPFPVGTGPYRLVKREPGVMELRANAHWHRGKPKYPNVRLVVIRDDNTRALRMLGGQGDLAIASIPPLLVPLFQDDERFETRSVAGISTVYLGFQTSSPKLDDVRVRRAIAFAIDRALLVWAKYEGLARVTDSWIPHGHWADVDTSPPRRFDPEQARALLDAAGFPDPVGSEPRMRLVLRTTSDRFRQSVARAIAAMLRDVGIEVDVQPSEAATLISDLNRGRFEITLLEVPEVIEPNVLSWFFESSRIPGPQSEGANRWGYKNEELDRLFELGRTEIDRAQRRAAYAEVQRVLARDLPVLPLWQPDTIAVVRSGSTFEVPRDGRFGTLAF
jgi:peptide/nickel transport system substrate-binding protein